jgi:hypothetical protein
VLDEMMVVMEPLRKGDPHRVGPYRLLCRLGGGGMGQVYLGRSRGGRPVAVKVVHPWLAADAVFRRRFATEVEAAGRVGGFHTAQVVDADPGGSPPWLVTAYIPGPSLQARVDEHGPLPPGAVAELGAALAEGLAAIHACGLVHRDLKPSNVILGADGPRVIDFGIARARDATSHTPSRVAVGTPAFMSPEQAAGRQVGPASDVFSLGSVLVFAATGRSPFGGGRPEEVMYRVIRGKPVLDGLPADLRELVGACLSKDPRRRPSVETVLRRLADRPAEVTGQPSPPLWAPAPKRPAERADTKRAVLRFPIVGGFGMFDVAHPPERCPDCGSEGTLPTDLYCGADGHFLPLIHRQGVLRVGVGSAAAVLILALFWLTAALHSAVPAFAAAASIGALAYLLPLRRHHGRTIWPAVGAYAGTFGGALLIHTAESGARGFLAATALVAALAWPVTNAALRVIDETERQAPIFARGPDNGVVRLGAIFTVVAMGAVLGWFLAPLFLDGPASGTARDIAMFVALVAFFAALAVSAVVSVIHGVRGVDTSSPRFRRPRRFRRVAWRATFSRTRSDRTTAVVDRTADLTRITLIRIADLLRITLVAAARGTVNLAAYLLRLPALLAIEVGNLIIKAALIALRAIWSAAARFVGSTARLLGFGLGCGGAGLASGALPVAALAGAAAFSLAFAEHLRDYLRDGALADLGWVGLQVTAVFALISVAWMLSANQRVRLSLRSAFRSAQATVPSTLVFIALGGWFFTVLSLLGVGDVRGGWLTWTATASLAIIFLFSEFRRRRTPAELPAEGPSA